MEIRIEKGESLYDALFKKGIVMDRPCGGRGNCGGCEVEVERFGKIKSCQFKLAGNYRVTVAENRVFDAVGAEKAEALWDGFPDTEVPVAAVDIGTTTVVVAAFYRGHSCVRSFTNPQRRYGADVMSRIQASVEGNGGELRQLILEPLLSCLKEAVCVVCPKAKACRVAVSANTAMIHLLCGWDCSGLSRAPFQPVSVDMVFQEWDCGLTCEVTILSGISAFVGADVVSGMAAVNLKEKRALLLDLGTNGEMALWNGKKLYVTAAAAGPAFEGSRLAMRIHAAGILKCLADMRKRGIMDHYGTLRDEFFAEGYPYSFYTGESGHKTEQKVYFTQEDIRQVQMAKGAVRAGMERLLQRADMRAEDLEQVYLAGGMGVYIRPEDAAAVGLLPEAFLDKTTAVGNTSLKGAVCYLRHSAAGGNTRQETAVMWNQGRVPCELLVLTEDDAFGESYVEYMNFPEA